MDCYSCKYRRPLSGDQHSSCQHHDRMVGGSIVLGRKALGITLIRHGVMHGWAMWPLNFDPIWIETCNGYTKKEE